MQFPYPKEKCQETDKNLKELRFGTAIKSLQGNSNSH